MNRFSRVGRRNSGFTLVEILIVVIILGILAAVVIANVSHNIKDVNDTALKKNLQDLRGAIQRYEAEHGNLPPVATFIDGMTLYSDISGATSTTKDDTFKYGPYVLRVPPLPTGSNHGKNGVTDTAGAANCGWVYDPTTGHIAPNLPTTETDKTGTPYNTY